MNRTNIPWALNPDGTPGYTWNPLTGCLNGCDYCYAQKLANGRLRKSYLANNWIAELWNKDIVFDGGVYEEVYTKHLKDPFYLRFWPEKVSEPHRLHKRKKKGVFVCSMSDLFGIGIPEKWTRQVLFSAQFNPKDRFYLLTKQPQNLTKFSPFPQNCYVGVTATDSESTFLAIANLNKIEAKVKYISFEPLLESICNPSWELNRSRLSTIDWIIIGALTCSGGEIADLSYKYPDLMPTPYGKKWTLQPKIEWVKEIVEAADKARVKVFLKESLMPLIGKIGNCKPEFTAIQENSPESHSIVLRQEIPC